MKRGYKLGLFSVELFGKTQHKTMQARLSEDILHKREKSVFFRTSPGRFFLRTFLTDSSVPEKYRTAITARRRRRELPVKQALAIRRNSEFYNALNNKQLLSEKPLSLHVTGSVNYVHSSNRRSFEDVLVWSFLVVMRGNHFLTYRHGPFREDRDQFMRRKSMAFYSPVSESDANLFDQENLGIVNSGLTTLCMELDLDVESAWIALSSETKVDNLVLVRNLDGTEDVLAILKFQCPDWFEPLTKRLSINHLKWQDLHQPINHLEDYDPWSQAVLQLWRSPGQDVLA